MADINFKIPCWYTCIKEPGMEDYDCRKICHRYMHMNYFIMNCGMPNAEKYLKPLTPSTKDKKAYMRLGEIKDNIADYVQNGNNLLITSNLYRNGKTTWSLKLMYKYFDAVWAGSDYVPRGYFIHVPDFLAKAKSFDLRNTLEFKEADTNIRNADLVIWDDITTNPISQNDQIFLNTYISTRLMRDKANIFNGYDNGKILENVGEMLASRLNSCEHIKFEGNPGMIRKK